jgi:aspartate/methionine/tyrosine aminotransferase
MTKEIQVATVPGSSFYRPGAPEGKRYIRFAFCKKHETLERAVENLSRLKAIV